MPQIFINDQRLGGLSGLQAALVQLGKQGTALGWRADSHSGSERRR
jgi:hypothetical protein